MVRSFLPLRGQQSDLPIPCKRRIAGWPSPLDARLSTRINWSIHQPSKSQLMKHSAKSVLIVTYACGVIVHNVRMIRCLVS